MAFTYYQDSDKMENRFKTVNTFSKGEHSDNDPNLQPDGYFTYSQNGRIINLGDGDFAWQTIAGNKYSFSICGSLPFREITPIGWCRLRTQLIVFSAWDETATGSGGEIGIVTINPSSGIGTYEARYSHQDLNFSKLHQIEAFAIYENTRVRRVYWTDFNNQFRSLNLELCKVTASGSIVAGKVYLVACGSITYNGTTYTQGQTFTAIGIAVYTGSGTLVEYVPIQQLDASPEFIWGEMMFDGNGTGDLLGGTELYTAQLYSTNGKSSDWFFISRPIHAGPNNPNSAARNPQDYQNYQGDNPGHNTGKSNRFLLWDFDSTSFDRIRIAAFHSDAYNSIGNGIIWYDGSITASPQIVEHTGSENLGVILLDDVTTVSLTILKNKTCTSLRHKCEIANINEREELDIGSTLSATITEEIYELPSDCIGATNDSPVNGLWLRRDGTGPLTFTALSGHWAQGEVITSRVDIQPGQWYKAYNGPCTYNGVVYPQYSVFQASVAGGFDLTAGSAEPIIHIKQYKANTPGVITNTRYRSYDAVSQIVYKDIPIAFGPEGSITGDFLDYKGTKVDHYCKGFWGLEKYRFGAMFLDDYGKPFYIRWIGDKEISQRCHNVHLNGNPAHRTADLITNHDYVPGSDGNFNLNVISLIISGIDVTDFIDRISGVCIVRAPRDETIIAEGLINCAESGIGPYPGTTKTPRAFHHRRNGEPDTREAYMYQFWTPEYYFGFYDTNNFKSHEIKITEYLRDPYRYISPNHLGQGEVSNHHYYCKLYIGCDPSAVLPGFEGAAIGASNRIADMWGVSEGTSFIYDVGAGYTYSNNPYYMGLAERSAAGGLHVMFKSVYAENTGVGSMPHGFGDYYPDEFTDCKLAYMIQREVKTTFYGGTSESALANTQYLFTGHYLKLDAATKARIFNAGTSKYILDDMQIFGGDCYVNIFDTLAQIKNEDDVANDPFSFGFLFPVQSKVNIALRQETHFAKDRSYESGVPCGTIRFATGSMNLEDFFYNKGYSTDDVSHNLVPLPENYILVDQCDFRMRWSPTKTPGELIDQYCKFLPNDYKDVESQSGPINNIRGKGTRIYYWQDDACGYFPIDERALIGDPNVMSIQLGTGGAFERFDEVHRVVGNQHQWSLVETDTGFAWVDFKRKLIMHMNYDFGLSYESIKKGKKKFMNSLNRELANYDNPVMGKGIAGGWDPKYKCFYMNFRDYTTAGITRNVLDQCCAFDTILDNFIGEHTIHCGMFMNTADMMFTARSDKYPALIHGQVYVPGNIAYDSADGFNYICILGLTYNAATHPAADATHWTPLYSGKNIWVHQGGNAGKFFGLVYPSILEYVNCITSDSAKVYDNQRFICNSFMFNNLLYSNSWQSFSEDIVDRNNNLLNKDFEMRDRIWIGSYPFTNSGRLVDTYVRVRGTYENAVANSYTQSRPNMMKLIKVLSSYRYAK